MSGLTEFGNPLPNGNNLEQDLSGKLVVKVQFGEEIRRVVIHNEDITYDELLLMIQRFYRGKISEDDEIVVKYKDEDGDMITMVDSADLRAAIDYSHVLRLKIFVKKAGMETLRSAELSSLDIRKELMEIRSAAENAMNIYFKKLNLNAQEQQEVTPEPLTSIVVEKNGSASAVLQVKPFVQESSVQKDGSASDTDNLEYV